MKFPANVDFQRGEASNFRVENLTTLPSFTSGDEGRLLFVTAGVDQGFWFGSSDGSNAFQRGTIGSTIGEYTTGVTAIDDGVTTQFNLATSIGTPVVKGYTNRIEILSTTVTSGQLRVELYEDLARTIKFDDIFFDLQATEIDRLAISFELNNVDGTLYMDVTNLSGVNGSFNVLVRTAAVVPITTPPPPGSGSGVNAGVAGEGITFDAINGRLDVALTSSAALELLGAVGSKTLGVKFAPGGGLNDTGTGAKLDPASAVVIGTDQDDITARKAFSQFGLVPAGSPGAPTTGTHNAGEFHLDSNLDLFQCTLTGTPGTWIFWGWKEERQTAVLGTVGPIASGATASVEIVTTGRRGFIRKFNVWGADSATPAATGLDAPFRVRHYPNENTEGREQIWTIGGQVRKTFLDTGASSGATVLEADDVTIINLDDLIRVGDTSDEEFQRVIARDTGAVNLTIDETLVTAVDINDPVMLVNEFIDLPWRNNSGVGANFQKMYLQFVNDGSVSMVLGYEILFENIGGGSPVV